MIVFFKKALEICHEIRKCEPIEQSEQKWDMRFCLIDCIFDGSPFRFRLGDQCYCSKVFLGLDSNSNLKTEIGMVGSVRMSLV